MAAAMLVPDSSNIPFCPLPDTSFSGNRFASVLPGAYSECSRRPGAAMSGFTCLIEQRRPAGAEVRDGVVAPPGRPVVVNRPHRQRVAASCPAT